MQTEGTETSAERLSVSKYKYTRYMYNDDISKHERTVRNYSKYARTPPPVPHAYHSKLPGASASAAARCVLAIRRWHYSVTQWCWSCISACTMW